MFFHTKLLSRLSHKVCRLLSSPVLWRKFTNKWRLRDGPTRRAQEGLLKLPDERQPLKRKENWRKLLLLGIQTGDKLAKPPFFVAYSRPCRHCLNLAAGGCRLSPFHFRLCRYFLGHVARRNLPWQGLYHDIALCRPIREIFCLWNPECWITESGIQFKVRNPTERLESGVQVSLTQNTESSTWNPESMALERFSNGLEKWFR